MGIFSDIFKDFSEMGSPIGKLRGKFADLSKLLTDYSFGASAYSSDLSKQQIIVAFNEMVEVANKCSPSDRVRLYFPSATLEPNVPVAVKAAEYWVDFVLEQGKKFTNSLAIQLIERAEYDLANQRTTTTGNSQATLGKELPNFISFMKEMSSVLTNCHKVSETATKIEYKAPILTYGRTMGYNHYIVEKSGNFYELYQVTNGNGGQKITTSKKRFSNDLDTESYMELFNQVAQELVMNPLYLQIATSGF